MEEGLEGKDCVDELMTGIGHKSIVEKQNSNGIYVIDHRFTNTYTIQHFNRIVVQHKIETFIAITKQLDLSI